MRIMHNFTLLILSCIIFFTRIFESSALECNMHIVETIPDDLTYDSNAPRLPTITSAWLDLIQSSKQSIHIASFYWTMLSDDISNQTYPSSLDGRLVFSNLVERSKEIPLEIVQNGTVETNDLKILKKNKFVSINYIDLPRLLSRGVQHAKVWIGDEDKAFIGSANMDWRSLSEIKELGVYITDCTEIVQDVYKFWKVLQYFSNSNSSIPQPWPSDLSPKYNYSNPLIVSINGVASKLYTATSPRKFNPPNRVFDLHAICNTIKSAKKFVYISVMDFFPLYRESPPKSWPYIENLLKEAAIERNIVIKLLISWWIHSSKSMLVFLNSLSNLSEYTKIHIEVKIFVVPAFNEYQKNIPYSRVSHSKYMVTDNTAYIGTSNWSGDYFEYTGGISLVAEELNPDPRNMKSIRTQLEHVFNTDWNSIYAHEPHYKFI